MFFCLIFTLTPHAEESELVVENDKLSVMIGAPTPWSAQLNFSYLGSSLETPFSKWAPNPLSESPAPRVVLYGTLSLRKKIDSVSSFGIGSGFQIDTPFHHPENPSVANPNLDYSFFANNQMTTISYSIVTDPIWKKYGSHSFLSFSQYYIFYQTEQWGLGNSLGISQNFYTQPTNDKITQTIAIYPFIEWRASSQLTFRQSFTTGIQFYNQFQQGHRMMTSGNTSLGYTLREKLYIAPYIYYSLEKIKNLNLQNTVLGLSFSWNLL